MVIATWDASRPLRSNSHRHLRAPLPDVGARSDKVSVVYSRAVTALEERVLTVSPLLGDVVDEEAEQVGRSHPCIAVS